MMQRHRTSNHPGHPTRKVILYAGAYWEQGAPLFRELLEALAQVKESHDIDPDFHFAFIGTGHPRLPSLQSIIDELGLSEFASEYPDRIPYLNVLSLLNQSWATMVIGSTARALQCVQSVPTSTRRKTHSRLFPSRQRRPGNTEGLSCPSILQPLSKRRCNCPQGRAAQQPAEAPHKPCPLDSQSGALRTTQFDLRGEKAGQHI